MNINTNARVNEGKCTELMGKFFFIGHNVIMKSPFGYYENMRKNSDFCCKFAVKNFIICVFIFI